MLNLPSQPSIHWYHRDGVRNSLLLLFLPCLPSLGQLPRALQCFYPRHNFLWLEVTHTLTLAWLSPYLLSSSCLQPSTYMQEVQTHSFTYNSLLTAISIPGYSTVCVLTALKAHSCILMHPISSHLSSFRCDCMKPSVSSGSSIGGGSLLLMVSLTWLAASSSGLFGVSEHQTGTPPRQNTSCCRGSLLRGLYV